MGHRYIVWLTSEPNNIVFERSPERVENGVTKVINKFMKY